MYQYSDRIVQFIRSWEGCSLTAYKKGDDKETIGWGNTEYEDGTPVKLGDLITQERADELNIRWCDKLNNLMNKFVGLPEELSQNQYDSLFSFAYNCGSGALKTSTLLKRIKLDPLDPDIKVQYLRWINKGSIFEAGLRKRRTAEYEIYFDNIYNDNE